MVARSHIISSSSVDSHGALESLISPLTRKPVRTCESGLALLALVRPGSHSSGSDVAALTLRADLAAFAA